MVTTASGLGQVLMASPQELAVIPLDLLNLLCASGLPDTADLDINACLKTLAGWAAHVGRNRSGITAGSSATRGNTGTRKRITA